MGSRPLAGRCGLEGLKTSEQRAEHELETRSQIWLPFFLMKEIALKLPCTDKSRREQTGRSRDEDMSVVEDKTMRRRARAAAHSTQQSLTSSLSSLGLAQSHLRSLIAPSVLSFSAAFLGIAVSGVYAQRLQQPIYSHKQPLPCGLSDRSRQKFWQAQYSSDFPGSCQSASL